MSLNLINSFIKFPPAAGGADGYQLEDGTGVYLAENGDRLILE